MHAKCLIAEPIAKKNDNICCNRAVVPNFVPIVCSTSKDKSVYIPHIKEIKKWRERLLSQSLHLGLNLRLWMDLNSLQLATIVV